MKNKTHLRTQMQGQAGVYAVASQLCLRGIIPLFPAVDYGYDIKLDNGLRIQVKTASLMSNVGNLRSRYLGGVYHFNTRAVKVGKDKKLQSIVRDYTKVADFFAFWGVDENRFWIVPTSAVKNSVFMCSRSPLNDFPQYQNIKRRNAGWENNWECLDMDVCMANIEAPVEEKL